MSTFKDRGNNTTCKGAINNIGQIRKELTGYGLENS